LKHLLRLLLLPIAAGCFLFHQGAKADERENDLFGESDASLFSEHENGEGNGEGASLKLALKEALQQKEKRLDIGGRFYYTNSLLVPEKSQLSDGRISTHGIVDLYFDARFDDNLRFYFQQKLSNAVASEQGVIPLVLSELGEKNDIDQLWIKFSFDQRYYFTVGKQPTKLGAGFVWQPTDFLNVDRYNPLDLSDQRLGVNLVKLQIPLPDNNLNIYAIAQLDDTQTLDEIGALLRIEYLSKSGEYALSVKSSKDSQLRLGFDASVGFKYFDWLLSTAAIHNDPSPFVIEALGPAQFLLADLLDASQTIDRSEEWFQQTSTGFLYTRTIFDNKTLIINGEYFYNEAGYTNRDVMTSIIINSVIPGSATRFNPLYFGKEYAAVGLSINGLGADQDQSISVISISNLDDQTGVTQVVYRTQLFRDLALSTSMGWFLGDEGVFRPSLGETNVPFAEDLLILPPRFNASLQLSLSF
jgi:hypothetical protein